MQATYSRDVRLSQAALWRLEWGREGWRVILCEPAPRTRWNAAWADVVVRYTLRRTPDARHPPAIP